VREGFGCAVEVWRKENVLRNEEVWNKKDVEGMSKKGGVPSSQKGPMVGASTQ